MLHPFKNLIKLLQNQRGAIFGMDARIALIVASVLAATGGITIMSRLDRTKIDMAERHLEMLRQGILSYYKTISVIQMPDSLETVFRENLIEDNAATVDPWGNPWEYSYTEGNVTIEGTEVAIRYAVLFSRGKDGINDSQPIYTPEDYAEWKPLNDDIGIKMQTRDIELERLEEYRARGQLVIDKLQDIEAKNYLTAVGDCESNAPLEYCDDYNGKNYTQFNFYMKSDLDQQAEDVAYFLDAKGGATTYTAGDLTDMRQLMKDIGLPDTYAQDPWGRVLFYHSNITGRENPPFSASICYSFSGGCFGE